MGAVERVLGRPARAATPKRGGHFKMGIGHGSTTDSLSPVTWENGYTLLLGFSFANYLTEIDNTGKLVGELAESWDASPDISTAPSCCRSSTSRPAPTR
jgi:peptide/nickel transport system substrate-binding protein